MTTPWQRACEQWPWPARCPSVGKPNVAGWLHEKTRAMLRRHLDDGANILEVGTWTGKSARWMLDCCPVSRLLSVDTFKGSRELMGARYHEDLAHLKLLAQAACWGYRDRLVLAEGDSVPTMWMVKRLGWMPQLVYIDGSHEEMDVYDDVTTAATLFPRAVLVGDDWDAYGVRPGVEMAAEEMGLRVENNGKAWVIC